MPPTTVSQTLLSEEIPLAVKLTFLPDEEKKALQEYENMSDDDSYEQETSHRVTRRKAVHRSGHKDKRT